MKQAILIILIAATFFSCDILRSPEGVGLLRTEFRLTDTLGFTTTIFRPGENFYMRYSITNETGVTQNYTIGFPVTVFEIWTSNSLVSSSIEGWAWIPVIPKRAQLENGQSVSDFWLAPNSPATGGSIFLNPGQYEARVHFGGYFDKYGKLPAERITFYVKK